MLSDAASLGIALGAIWLAEKPATLRRSFGYQRAEILAALANGLTLVVISLWIFYEAFQRLQDPPEVLGGTVLVIAVIGLAVNLGAAWVLSRGSEESLAGAARLDPDPPRAGAARSRHRGDRTTMLGDSGLSLALVAAGAIVFRVYLGFEEEHLERTFGEHYTNYKRRTARFAGINAKGAWTRLR